MVRDVDDSLLDLIAQQLSLVLDAEDGSRQSIFYLLANNVEHPQLHGPGIPLVTIRTQISVKQRILSITPDDSRAFKVQSSKPTTSPVQGVRRVVDLELILPAVQVLNHTVLDAVRDTADGRAEPGLVVLFVVFLLGEALDDVLAVDVEFLDDGGESGEFDGGVVAHFVGFDQLFQDLDTSYGGGLVDIGGGMRGYPAILSAAAHLVQPRAQFILQSRPRG